MLLAHFQASMLALSTLVPTYSTYIAPVPLGPDDSLETPWSEAGVSLSLWGHYMDLADCESGDWNRNAQPIEGSRRWDYGLSFDHGDWFEGGLNFHPVTWESYKDPDMPDHAGHSPVVDQVQVAERVRADQGWKAWPVCSRKLGLR